MRVHWRLPLAAVALVVTAALILGFAFNRTQSRSEDAVPTPQQDAETLSTAAAPAPQPVPGPIPAVDDLIADEAFLAAYLADRQRSLPMRLSANWNLKAGQPNALVDLSLRIPSGTTAHDLRAAIAGTELESLAAAFVRAEREYGVNALALTAIAALESNWGRSRLAETRNNLFGFGAYPHDPNQALAFASGEDAVLTVARYLAAEYLSPDGKHYKGESLTAIGASWATDPDWPAKVAAAWASLLQRIPL